MSELDPRVEELVQQLRALPELQAERMNQLRSALRGGPEHSHRSLVLSPMRAAAIAAHLPVARNDAMARYRRIVI